MTKIYSVMKEIDPLTLKRSHHKINKNLSIYVSANKKAAIKYLRAISIKDFKNMLRPERKQLHISYSKKERRFIMPWYENEVSFRSRYYLKVDSQK